eukprot:1699726-Prymnesium_polylepis.1
MHSSSRGKSASTRTRESSVVAGDVLGRATGVVTGADLRRSCASRKAARRPSLVTCWIASGCDGGGAAGGWSGRGGRSCAGGGTGNSCAG